MTSFTDLPTEALTAPLSVSLDITGGCNIQCHHCAFVERVPEPSLTDLKELIRALKQAGVFYIGLGGRHEPTFSEHLFFVLEYIVELGFVFRIATNGTLVTPAFALELAKLKPDGVTVSLDGASAEVNDAIRGPGTYEKTTRAIRLLSERGINVNVAAVILESNFADIPQMVDLAMELGAKSFSAIRFHAVKDAKDKEDLRVPGKEYKNLVAQMRHIQEQNPDFTVNVDGRFFDFLLDEEYIKDHVPCTACRSACYIECDGTVYPCPHLDIPLGNLRQTALTELWKTAPVSVTIRQQEYLRGKCLTCRYCSICMGGCLAEFLNEHNQHQSCDPDCWYNENSTN